MSAGEFNSNFSDYLLNISVSGRIPDEAKLILRVEGRKLYGVKITLEKSLLTAKSISSPWKHTNVIYIVHVLIRYYRLLL